MRRVGGNEKNHNSSHNNRHRPHHPPDWHARGHRDHAPVNRGDRDAELHPPVRGDSGVALRHGAAQPPRPDGSPPAKNAHNLARLADLNLFGGDHVMNLPFRLGSIVLGATFILSLIAAAWSDAPGFITFVAANRAFFMGVGVGIIASNWLRRPLALILIIGVVFVVLKLLGI